MGGLGEKVSNGGTQYYFQDRVYSSESVAVSIATAFNPYYLVKVKNERSVLHSNSRAAGKNNRTTEQQVELGSSKFMNCITTVAKDGMLLIKETENETICGHIENREK